MVRLFHWSLALAFFANYFFTEEGETWHEWIGYYAFAFVLVRVIWGFVTSGAASWRQMWPTFSRLRAHVQLLRQGLPHRELGHSPIGALVMLMLMLAMLGLGVTGFMMEEIDYFWGEDWVEELHEQIANGLALLVVVHIAAAVVESIRLGENLPLSMITGKRRAPE